MLQEVTGGDRAFLEVTGGYNGLEGLTRNDKG